MQGPILRYALRRKWFRPAVTLRGRRDQNGNGRQTGHLSLMNLYHSLPGADLSRAVNTVL